ncbi:MAG: hypothetical protein R6U94_06335 [Nitriliruptoraceae bacterium]
MRAWSPGAAAAPPARILLLLAVVLSLFSCTSGASDDVPLTADAPPMEEPVAAPAGRVVEIVLPARSRLAPPVAEGLEVRLGALAAGLPGDIDSLAVRAPDDEAFVPDLLELAAAEGAGLVCALGPQVADDADRTAVRHGATRVCAMPVALPVLDDERTIEPTPAVRVDVPVEELGFLVGVAAQTAARGAVADAIADAEDARPEGPVRGPVTASPRVALLLGGDELPSARFRAGLLEGLGPVEVIEPATSDTPPDEALEEVLVAGAQVVVVDGGPEAAQIVAALDGQAEVVGPIDLWDDDLPPEVALAYRLRWEVVVSVVLDSFAGPGELGGPVLLGAQDGVLELSAGPGQAAILAAVEAARAELAVDDDPRAPLPDEDPRDAVR